MRDWLAASPGIKPTSSTPKLNLAIGTASIHMMM
eukprot:COSAG01_NODE_9145_length_2539_cov_1.593852_1_plen_33_part_10